MQMPGFAWPAITPAKLRPALAPPAPHAPVATQPSSGPMSPAASLVPAPLAITTMELAVNYARLASTAASPVLAPMYTALAVIPLNCARSTV
jgi:hypothetical protein